MNGGEGPEPPSSLIQKLNPNIFVSNTQAGIIYLEHACLLDRSPVPAMDLKSNRLGL